MPIRVERAGFSAIAQLREDLRREARCQIVRDSILPRGLADPLVIRDGASTVGYAGIWNRHFPGRLMEFFVAQERRERTAAYFLAVVNAAEVAAVEAQTNMPLQYSLLLKYVESLPTVENLLFGEGVESPLIRPDLIFRPRSAEDAGPEGEWVVERRGAVVGVGGFLTHYNPPYADLYMEVLPGARGQGVGSFLVQELRRVCRKSGKVPAARCDPSNEASRRTLLRGGLVQVGEIVVGGVGSSRAATV